MILNNESTQSSLGERLRQGVLALWQEVTRIGKVLDHHGAEIELLKKRLRTLEKDARGLRISRGRAKAKNAQLETALVESEQKLAEIRSVLH